ncbi:MAG: TIGR03936 family radical SAM-associated protein [Acetatifactor sp.]
MKLRVKFKKYGALRFIGHLDVMRFFQKAIRRAGIDIAYTGGYSPHQIMTFASPLGVGLESNGEYMDIEVCSMTSCTDIMERLNQASVNGIEIVSVKILPEDAGNAMASVASAVYTVKFREGRMPQTDIHKLVAEFLTKEEIWYTKESKKGKREVDLKPGIYSLKWENNSFSMHLNASSAGNIKPGQVLEAMFSSIGVKLPDNAFLITREDLFTNTGTEDNRILTSLGDIGTL